MKPPLYSQHYAGQASYGGMPPDGGYHGQSMGSHMGAQRMPHACYPPMMRIPGGAGPRQAGIRPGGPNPMMPPQPNNLRLQLQHRLQAQLVGGAKYLNFTLLFFPDFQTFYCTQYNIDVAILYYSVGCAQCLMTEQLQVV